MRGIHGFGAMGLGEAVTFSASQVWQDQLAGSKGDNAASRRWAQTMQLALNAVQNAGLKVDGIWGNSGMAAWKTFCNKHGIPYGPAGYPTGEDQLDVLEEAVSALNPKGGNEIPGAEKTKSGGLAPAQPGGGGGDKPPTKAGLSTGAMIGLGVAGAVVLGALVFASKGKGAAAVATAPAQLTPVAATPNRRRGSRKSAR